MKTLCLFSFSASMGDPPIHQARSYCRCESMSHISGCAMIRIAGSEKQSANVVFHSLRHTSTDVKFRLSKGDLKAVQGDGGWNSRHGDQALCAYF